MHYVLMTGILWCVFNAYWFFAGRHLKRAVYRKNGIGEFLLRAFGLMPILMLYSHYGAFGLPEVQIIPATHFWGILGVLLAALGVGWAIWARRTMGANWSNLAQIKQDHEFITGGPYRFARHPIYTGLITATLGSALAVGYPRAFGALLFTLFALRYKIKVEERLMLRQFPAEYPAYRRRVKAVIPFVL